MYSGGAKSRSSEYVGISQTSNNFFYNPMVSQVMAYTTLVAQGHAVSLVVESDPESLDATHLPLSCNKLYRSCLIKENVSPLAPLFVVTRVPGQWVPISAYKVRASLLK